MKQTVETTIDEFARWAEKSLAEDWLKPEEDVAWLHLNQNDDLELDPWPSSYKPCRN